MSSFRIKNVYNYLFNSTESYALSEFPEILEKTEYNSVKDVPVGRYIKDWTNICAVITKSVHQYVKDHVYKGNSEMYKLWSAKATDWIEWVKSWNAIVLSSQCQCKIKNSLAKMLKYIRLNVFEPRIKCNEINCKPLKLKYGFNDLTASEQKFKLSSGHDLKKILIYARVENHKVFNENLMYDFTFLLKGKESWSTGKASTKPQRNSGDVPKRGMKSNDLNREIPTGNWMWTNASRRQRKYLDSV